MAFDLVNGQLLNSQNRQRGSRGTVLNSDANDTDGAVELAARSECNSSEPDTSAIPPQSKSTPTRLPVLRVFRDKDLNERKDTTVPEQQKIPDGSSEYDSPKSLDQERERYWRKVRARLDRDTPSPRSKEKQKINHHGAYRKIISLASSPRQEIAKHKWKHSGGSPGDKPCTPETNPPVKTKSSTPERRDNSKESTLTDRDQFADGKGRTNSNHSASSDGSGSSSRKYKTGSTTGSSLNSNSSVSPISGPSSIKEWEDRFVVHMPSAREPNPPTMNVRQIAQYQRSIEKVQKEGGSMVDPDTLPSPRIATPEERLKSPDLNGKRLGTLDGQDSRPCPSDNDADIGLTHNPNNPRYYCPDEVGKQRFSTIWEESSMGPKQKSHHAGPDGSFLGCREINGAPDRNPDDILYFSTPERPKIVNVPPSRMPRVPKQSRPTQIHQTKGTSGETNFVQEEWESISQNLKHAQCSKPSPKLLCREAQCQQLKARRSTNPETKEDPDTTRKQARPSENQKPNTRADDVFIITPTITRTMVTMADLKGSQPKQPTVREPTARSAGEIITDARTRVPINIKTGASPLGLRRASQNSSEKSNTLSAKPSDPTPGTNIPIVRHRTEPRVTATEKPTAVDKPRGMRGFIRTPGIPRSSTEPRVEPRVDRLPDKPSDSAASSSSTRASNIPPRKSTPSYPEGKNSNPTNKTDSSRSVRRSLSQPGGTIMQAKIFDVAELDGHQVDDHREDNSDNRVPPSNHGQRDNKIQPDIKGIRSSEALHVIIDLIFLFVAQVQEFCCQIKANRTSKVVLLKLSLNGILGMLEHCLHVLRKGLFVISAYNTTGVWPKAHDKDIAWLLTDLSQALVYLVVLGFVGLVIARAVGFVILVGTWIVWFVRPFALAFRLISRVLFL